MDHIDVTSQLVRHQLLMDLAKAVKKQLDNHPHPNPDQEAEPEPPPPIHYFHSSK